MNIEELKEYFKYDNVTGKLFWNKRPSNRVLLGQEVGNHNDQGYKVCRFKGKAIRVHRIVWALNKEELPSGFIDHINGIRDDNRMENLRVVSHAQNLQNMKRAKGYAFHKKNNKWTAQIAVDKQHKYLGSFDTEQEAHNAYLKAKQELHPYFVKESDES
jgi:hypothetical protein